MSFGNPLGFLALVGVPIVLFIHLLQVRSRRVQVTTLFLLEPRAFERESGRKIDRLTSSPLLWLQLLAVVVATWLLVEPRWLREDTTLNVVLVVDGSASMSAYRDEVAAALEEYLPEIERAAETVGWTVLASDPAVPTLYAGDERDAARSAALGWRPLLGAHDIGASLPLASSIAGPRGIVVLLTDHVRDVPAGVEVLAVGTPIENVGLVSVSLEANGWRAIVKNSGAAFARRSWWLEVDGAPGETFDVALEPGDVSFLAGDVPPGAERLELVLEPDRFELDDRLPFLVPRPKTLRVFVSPEHADDEFIRGFLDTLEPFELVQREDSDLSLGSAGPSGSILFAETAPGYLDGPIVVDNVGLVEGLDFRGLVARNGVSADVAANGDHRVLVWQGGHAILMLSEIADSRVLRVGFPLSTSNAARIPAFVIALHRFAETIRRDKRAFSRDNVETGQILEALSGQRERAPREPGFFEIPGDGAELSFEGAAHFADVRESDLTGSRSLEPTGDVARDALVLNSLPDPLSSMWLLLLMGVATIAWSVQEKGA